MSMGPYHHTWASKGKLGQLFPLPHLAGGVSLQKLRWLMGATAAFYQMYAFSSVFGGVDVYVRRSGAIPAHRFWHYRLAVDSPDKWWQAKGADFLGLVDEPEWVEGRLAIRDAPPSRL